MKSTLLGPKSLTFTFISHDLAVSEANIQYFVKVKDNISVKFNLFLDL
jgi:hypothetical protein